MNENEYQEIDENFDIDDLETALQNHLDAKMEELQVITENEKKIGSPDALGDVIMESVWDQFIIQIGAVAGEDFVKENRGLKLNLSKDAHIQTVENFEKGVIATHNTQSAEQLQENYDRYANTSHKEFRKEYVNPGMNETLERAGDLNKKGVETVTDIYTGRQIPTQTKLEDGTNNPKAAQREHVIPSEKVYQDASLQMSKSNQELADVINNPENLQGYTTAERNNRKSNNTPDAMEDRDKNKHWEKANEKAEKYIEQEREKGEKRLEEEGRQSRKEEAARAGKAGLRAVLLSLLASLVKEIIQQLIAWFKSGEKKFSTFIDKMKVAFKNCFGKLATYIQAADALLTSILSAIFGPIVSVIKKVGLCIKKGWQSLKDAIKYVKDPKNRNKDFGILVLEVGKIITAGVSAVMSIVLGELITKGLESVGLVVQIPLLGSLASIIGMFGGALISGVVGAVAINLIEKLIAKKQKDIAIAQSIEKKNEVMAIQTVLIAAKEEKLEGTKQKTAESIANRHTEAALRIQKAVDNIYNTTVVTGVTANSDALDKLDSINSEIIVPNRSSNSDALDNLDNLLNNLTNE